MSTSNGNKIFCVKKAQRKSQHRSVPLTLSVFSLVLVTARRLREMIATNYEESAFSDRAIASDTQEGVVKKLKEEKWTSLLMALLFHECCYCKTWFKGYMEEIHTVNICVSVDLNGRPSLTRACWDCRFFREELGKAINSSDVWISF